MSNAFSSDELLANQGIYSRVSKNAVLIGAAVAYGMKGTMNSKAKSTNTTKKLVPQ